MKSEDIFSAIGNIDDEILKNAKTPPHKTHRPVWVALIAAILSLSLIVGFILAANNPLGIFSPGDTTKIIISRQPLPTKGPYVGSIAPDLTLLTPYLISEASYPLMTKIQSDSTPHWSERSAMTQAYEDLDIDISDFLYATVGEFLKHAEGGNFVYSPLNVFMAFAMLAEVTDGESREQILNVLGYDDMETLRDHASAIWLSSYLDDGTITTLLASSIWLSETMRYNQDTIDRLSEIYYTCSFQGKMGSVEYNKALRAWLNANTGNLLTDSVNDITMNPSTVMALATTIYFNADWQNKFNIKNTRQGIFHGENSELTCDFMHGYQLGTYYTAKNFTAIKSEFATGSDKSGMWLILPDKGVSPEKLINDSQLLSCVLSQNQDKKWKNQKECIIHLTLPKFDISSDLDLTPSMKNLGITNVFDASRSDFSPLTEDTEDIMISSAQHSVRVLVDEEGCTATGFTVMNTDSGGTPTPHEVIDFTLDRPFLFVITSEVGLPLFIGIVNQPS